jgi:hypothetical protein
VSYLQPAPYPIALLAVTGGPGFEVTLSSSDFTATDNGLESAVLPLPTHGTWPLVVALVSSPGDALARVSGAIELEPNREYQVAIGARANLVGLFACAPLLGQAAIRRADAAPPDTLYVWTTAKEPGKFPPVC